MRVDNVSIDFAMLDRSLTESTAHGSCLKRGIQVKLVRHNTGGRIRSRAELIPGWADLDEVSR